MRFTLFPTLLGAAGGWALANYFKVRKTETFERIGLAAAGAIVLNMAANAAPASSTITIASS